MTLISAVQTSKKNILNNKSGFSLIEIMVSIVLVASLITLIPSTNEGGDHDDLKASMDQLKRASRFSVNEAILRNVIVRINFNLEALPVEYNIEYGKKASLVLPETVDTSRLSIKEREALDESSKKFSHQFNPVVEFEEGSKKIAENIQFYGLGTTYYASLISEGAPSIYFYPTGEKDSAILFFYSPDEIATLEISPFEDTMRESYYPFTQSEKNNFDDALERKTKEIFTQWLEK